MPETDAEQQVQGSGSRGHRRWWSPSGVVRRIFLYAPASDGRLCERGVRGFATETRATLDLSAVPFAKGASRLPVAVDPSHAAGRRDLLEPLSAAAFAAGADAVMLEVHPDPDVALSDAQQQLSLEGFADLQRTVAARLTALSARLSAEVAVEPTQRGERRCA